MKNKTTHKCDICDTEYYLNNPVAYKCKCGEWMLNIFDPYISEKRKLYHQDIELEISE
jgi:hypothetical protein